ncbi:MAG: phospho-N-acetylmuramoyl-pentapeptide-transferase [Peptoniphilaceae bacterium]|nr:phospho-N-acetylmuramoyl-pentapeptide-transferase [Peptoniphilaceae bacterium]MDY6085616.1 phospho-N-acetylmuramoyl-pentapeptide-transferase [Peptoniphilaceae bacterium]
MLTNVSLARMGLLSILLSVAATWAWIRFSKRESIGQEIRQEGNKAHYQKQGTPTMGGVAFTLVFLVLLFVYGGFNYETFIIMAATVGFSAIGFLDDAAKVYKRQSEGLTPRQKLILQFGIAGLLVLINFFSTPEMATQTVPLFGWRWHWGILWIPVLAFVIVGTVNATNLTDGLDGLAGGVSVPVFLTMAFLGAKERLGNGVPTVAALLFAGVLVGFLFFNNHPAQVFMGDTGSMAIGGALCGMLLLLNRLPFLLFLGGIYLVEALSVMIQVTYFRHTGGKRIFLMSPIHHHFELKGIPEQKVTASFRFVSVLLCLVTIWLW